MYLYVDSNLSFLGLNKLGLPAGALESEESTLNIHSQKNNYSVANPPLPSERVPALRKTRILYLTSRGIY